MERNLKITIPEPCHENWDKMTPNDNGRFCLSCSKTVIDFTTMLPEEIQQYIIQNQDQKICGRFRKSQLNSITIQIPDRILYTQTHYHKMFLLALFITMGTTLFSCADNEGNKVTIDKIEVVGDNPQKGLDKSDSTDIISHKKPPAPPLSITVEGISEPSVGTSGYYPHDTTSGGLMFESIEAPDYPGGFEKFSEFIKNEFQIPKKARRLTGEIEVSFVVNTNGTLEQFKVFDNIGHNTGEEIIRVLQSSKRKWKPKTINGRAFNDTLRMNIVVQKDSLNIERKNRKFSTIASINRVQKNEKLASKESESLAKKNVTQECVVEDNSVVYMGAAIVTNANYPAGINAFYDFFNKEFKIPETFKNSANRIIVSFIIEKDGSLTSIEFPKNTDSQLESEITRVIKMSPKWIPGEQNGKKTREKFSFPIAIEKWK